MSTTTSSTTTTSTIPHVAPTTAIDTTSAHAIAARPRRARWPLMGLVAAASGFGASMAGLSNAVTKEEAQTGPGVIDHLDRAPYHVAFVLGIVSITALFFTAAGWRRWAAERAPGDLAARTIGHGLTAVATINVVFTAFVGSMSIYLPGGSDAGWLSREQLFVIWSMLDFGTLLGWWGAIVAAVAVVWVAFGTRALPRWMGVVSAVLILPPLGIGLATGLPGLPGLTMPIWLAVVSVGMVVSRRAQA